MAYTPPNYNEVKLDFHIGGYTPPSSQIVKLEFAQDIIIGVVYDIVNAEIFENLELPQVHNLTIQDAVCAQPIDNILLTQIHHLQVNPLINAELLDALSLTQVHNLSVDSISDAASLDGLLVLVENKTLAVASLSNAQTLDNLLVSLHLVLQDLLQGQTLGSVNLPQIHNLIVDALQNTQIIGPWPVRLTEIKKIVEKFGYALMKRETPSVQGGTFDYVIIPLKQPNLGKESDLKYKKVS